MARIHPATNPRGQPNMQPGSCRSARSLRGSTPRGRCSVRRGRRTCTDGGPTTPRRSRRWAKRRGSPWSSTTAPSGGNESDVSVDGPTPQPPDRLRRDGVERRQEQLAACHGHDHPFCGTSRCVKLDIAIVFMAVDKWKSTCDVVTFSAVSPSLAQQGEDVSGDQQ